MAAPVAFSKVHQRTLSHLRAILRHARDHFDAVEPPARAGASAGDSSPDAGAGRGAGANASTAPSVLFRNFVLGEYRAARGLTDRARLRELREHGAEVAAYLAALRAQAALLSLHRGVDPDRPLQRRAVARLVGLELPRTAGGADAAAAPAPRAVGHKYADGLRARLGAGSEVAAAHLTGIDNLKAQYYGLAAPALAAAEAAVTAADKARSEVGEGREGGPGG